MNHERTIHVVYSGPEIVRLDQAVVQALRRDYSRTFCQHLIKEGRVTVEGVLAERSCDPIAPGSAIQVRVPTVPSTTTGTVIPLPDTLAKVPVIYEHEHFVVINKPAGVLVHAAETAPGEVTLVDMIQGQFEVKGLESTLRPGIIHRLDRDTSGIMVIVKTPQAHAIFSELFQNRAITKCYHAVVQGHPPREGELDWNIVRHPRNRLMMTHSRAMGREAYTRYRVIEYFETTALLELFPRTGRTHQLRVHCCAMGHPIIGDPVYGESSPFIARQALHAVSLQFVYDGVAYAFSAPYADDLQKLIAHLAEPL